MKLTDFFDCFRRGSLEPSFMVQLSVENNNNKINLIKIIIVRFFTNSDLR